MGWVKFGGPNLAVELFSFVEVAWMLRQVRRVTRACSLYATLIERQQRGNVSRLLESRGRKDRKERVGNRNAPSDSEISERAKGAEKASCGEAVVQSLILDSPFCSLPFTLYRHLSQE